MDYSDFTKEQLLERIEELEILNRQLLHEKEQETRLEYAWTGNLGHWYWNIRTNAVTFNPLKITTLGYDPAEMPQPVPYQFFTERIHPEDLPLAMDVMRNHLYGRAGVYEVEYRIQAKDGNYKWYYDRGRITQYDENGKPVFLAGIVFDITAKKAMQIELEQKNKILAEQAEIDGLTQIGNHRTLIEHLKAKIVDANRLDKPLSVALFDIDNFKQVNDSKGHIYGDKVLMKIAALIKESVRDSDFPGRYGGEEFMVIFPNADLTAAARVAERIRQAVESNLFDDGLTITISGGVQQYHGEELSELIHAADMKLYAAKKRGKNQIVS
ncbi:MAG TPA: sensor domain-containing diguanylate cyclase [Syntrophomonas sp.]|nr:sensor domain-containing diguanylate cyclase [Syntrophomonas sp.]HRW11630.1 sensor domain-containing diguanylate cyclase [Syntrophomonas sp.]